MTPETNPIGINEQRLWTPGQPLSQEELIAIGATDLEAQILANEDIDVSIPEEEIERQLHDLSAVSDEIRFSSILETKIIQGKASNTEIFMWYKTQDPLRMRRVFDDFIAKKVESFNQVREDNNLRKAIILENGAETLVLNTLSPGWQSNKSYESPNAVELANAPMDLLNLSVQALDINKDKKYDTKELKDLITASNMLEEHYDLIKNSTLVTLPDSYGEIMTDYKLKLLDFVITNGECRDEIDWLVRGDAYMRYASNIFFGLKNVSATVEEFNQTRGHLISQIADEVGNISGNITTKSNRGFIHEYLWILDSMMYAYINKKTNFYVVPSRVYEDEPTIGRTNYNRAFDLYLGKIDGDEKLIQLKSSTRDWGKNYHQTIDEIKEEQFKDGQPSRLMSKLRNYKKIINNEVVDKRQVFSEYSLPSVIKTLDDFLATE